MIPFYKIIFFFSSILERSGGMTSIDFSAPRRGDPSAIFHSLCKAVAGILIWTAVVVILRLLVLQVEPPETSNTDPFSFLGVLSVDALLLLISVLYSIIGWRKRTIQLNETAVSVSSGVISSSYVTLPFSDLKRLEYTDKGLCKLFGTGKIRFSNQQGWFPNPNRVLFARILLFFLKSRCNCTFSSYWTANGR